MSEQAIGSTILRQQLTDVLHAVREQGVVYVVETFGRPQAALVNFDEYAEFQRYQRERKAFFDWADDTAAVNAAENAGLSDDEVLAIIEQARQEVAADHAAAGWIMLRVVIDTSSLISYVLTRGKLMRQIVGMWRDSEITVLSSPATRAELAAVIARPAIQRMSARPMDELVVGLERYSEPVPGRLSAAGACRDPKDDKFLACAAEGHAHYLVSSDKDLLVLRRYEDTAIVNPGQFLLAAELYEMTVEDMLVRFTPDVLAQILPIDSPRPCDGCSCAGGHRRVMSQF